MSEARTLRRAIALNRRPFGRAEAAFYEWLAAPAVSRIVAPVLVDALAAAPPGAVLDVGCGGGAVARALQTATGRTIVGIDPSLPQLRRVRRDKGRVLATLATAGATDITHHRLDGLPFLVLTARAPT